MNRSRRSLAALASLAAVLTVGGLALPAAGAAAPPYGNSSDDAFAPCAATITDCPSADPFFAAPAGLASLADGHLVGSRTATIAQPGPMVKAAYTISYRSEDEFGAAVLDSATVLLPQTAYTGAGSTPVVAFAFAEDSVGRQCAPSYGLAHEGTNGIITAESGDLQALLTQGYVVVIPDAEGPAEQFIVGGQEGHAVLDSVRAAESFAPTGLTPSSRVALMGYSGGAHTAGWAAELAGSYAPTLNIIGAIEGGTPANLSATAKYNDGKATFGLVLLSTIGLDRGFPGAGLQGDLNAKGKAAFATAQSQCVNAIADYAFGSLNDYTTTPDLIDTPTFQATLGRDMLGQRSPGFPIFNYHATTDEIVPYPQDKTLVDTYCAHGVKVDHVAFPADHLTGEAIGLPLALAWLQGRLLGAPVPDTCAVTGGPGAAPGPSALPTPPPHGSSQSVGSAATNAGTADNGLAFTGLDAGIPVGAALLLITGLLVRRASRRAPPN